MSNITIKAPAKINLCLRVLGKRPDGYHDIENIMLPISLYDRIELETIPKGIQLWCDHPQLQIGEQNLAQQAACAMLAIASPDAGVKIKLYKQIPLAAGLGGGSSDAAAVLRGLNHIWDLGVDRQKLLEIGEELGADVPFFVSGCPAVARGKGEELTPVSFDTVWLVLVNPGFGVNTAEAYAGLNLGLTKKRSYTKIPPNSFSQCKPAQIASWLENDLESPVINTHPVIKEIKDCLLARGALGALMSGSGPTVFGLFASRGEAQAVCRELQAEAQAGWSVYLAHTRQGLV